MVLDQYSQDDFNLGSMGGYDAKQFNSAFDLGVESFKYGELSGFSNSWENDFNGRKSLVKEEQDRYSVFYKKPGVKRKDLNGILNAVKNRFNSSTMFQSIKPNIRGIEGVLMDIATDVYSQSVGGVSLVDLINESSILGGEELEEHLIDTSIMAIMLSKYMGLTSSEATKVGAGALFHDYGKFAISPKILARSKVRNNVDDKMYVSQIHGNYGYQMLSLMAESEDDLLNYCARIARDHHIGANGVSLDSDNEMRDLRIVQAANVVVNNVSAGFNGFSGVGYYFEPERFLNKLYKVVSTEENSYIHPDLLSMITFMARGYKAN